MNMKKAVCALLAALQVTTAAGCLPVAHASQETPSRLEPKMVSNMPVIDGKLDDSVWNLQNSVGKPLQDGTQHSASFDVLWDYEYLYAAVRVENDPELIAGSAWMEGDMVSLLFDKTNHKSAPYAEGDWQIGIGYNPEDAFDPFILFGGGVTALTEARDELERNILAATSETEDGWDVEIAVPWDSLGIDPYLQKDFGFDIGVDNKLSSHSAGQVDYLLWETNGQASFWNNTAGFGDISLSTDTVKNTDDGVVYAQNFDSIENGALPEGFSPIAGQESGWSVQDGRLVGDFSNGSAIERRIALPALGGNFTYDLDFTIEDAVDARRWLSAFYRAPLDNGDGYYHFTNRLNGAGEISVKGADNTWPTAFVNTDGTSEASPLEKSDPYHLSITALGQNLTHVRTGSKEEEGFNHNVNTYEKIGESRPATTAADLRARGRFGLQADRLKATFDNLVIRRLDIDKLHVEGLPDSIEQLSVLPEMQISADCSNGKTIPVDRNDARVYSSDETVLRVLDDGTIRSLRTGKSTISVIVANRLYTKEIEVTKSDRVPAITELHVQGKQGVYPVVQGQTVPVSMLKFDAVDELLESHVLSGADAGIALASSDESVVKIENGQFAAVGVGTASVTATIDGASDSIFVWVRADENDDVFFKADFEDGNLPADWKQIGGGYTIGEENGNHFLEMQPSTRFIIPMPEGTADYTVEADMTFMQASNSARWASIMYRVQNQDRPYYQFAVRQDSTATNGVEFAAMTENGAWDVRETASFDGKMEPGLTRHLKVTITGDRVKEWIDGKELIFTDKAADLGAGDIGLQSNLVTVRFDNVTVRLNPEPLPDIPKPENNYAKVKNLSDHLVAAPTVIVNRLSSLDGVDALISDDVTSSVMLRARTETDGMTALYSGDTRIGDLQSVTSRLYGKILLLIELEDQDTADALAAFIEENKMEDLQVASADGALLRAFREKATKTRASLILTNETLTMNDAYQAVRAANAAKAKNVIIRQSAADKTVVEAMQRRLMSVWVVSDDTTVGLFGAIQSGANGIITGNPEKLDGLAEFFTGRTITRRSFMIGHRGTPGSAPENTMAGYIMAFEKFGAQMFENDVYLSKDKEVIILHDDTFARTTDILTNQKIPDSVFTNGVTRQNCRPKDLTLEQIKMLDAGSYYGPEFAGEPIPTLREQLEYMKGKDVVLFLELKDASDGIEKACTDLIKEYGLEDQVCAITFNAKSVPIALEELPTLSLGYLSGVGSVDVNNPMVTVRKALNQILPMNTTFNPSYGAIHNETFIQQMQGRGMTLWPWTYNDRSGFDWAIDHGINGLTTNYANWAMDYVFGIQAEKDNYNLKEGESVSLKATGETNIHEIVTYDAPEIVVLDGGDCINVSGNTVTGIKAGTATVALRVGSKMGEKTYDLYSKPVTLTVDAVPSEHMLTVNFPKNVKLSIGGEEQKLANLLGAYKAVVMADTGLEFSFAPAVEGREIAGITVNGEAVEVGENFNSNEYILKTEMPNKDTEINLDFVVVDKQILRTTIAVAEDCAEEAAQAVGSVQKMYEAALKAAKAVEKDKTATQAEINDAWSDLLDALHYLSFVKGDKEQLKVPMEIAEMIDRDRFTPNSVEALDKAYADAADLMDDEDVLEADVKAAVDALYDALNNLVERANISDLEALIVKGEGIDQSKYFDDDAMANFRKVLEEAKELKADANATQKAVGEKTAELSAAIAALRVIPNKDALKGLVEEGENTNTANVPAAVVNQLAQAMKTAKEVLANDNATEEDVKAAVNSMLAALNAVENAKNNNKPDNTSKKSSKPTRNTSNTYGAAGIVSASQSAASVNSNVITLKHGQFYVVKVTAANGTVPNFTVGNGSVLKTQFVAKIGNEYTYKVWAIGAPGESAGVYAAVDGQGAKKLCGVEIVA